MAELEKHCKTIILCGGKGRRLGTLGESIPKALVELDEHSILYHKLKHSIKHGFDDMIFATGYKGNMIVDACRNMRLNFKSVFSNLGVDAGMLRRIYEVRNMFQDRVIVTYGDSIANLQLLDLVDFHIQSESLLSIVSAPIQSPFGLITSDYNSQVISLKEKPVLHYYIGTFIMERKAIEYIPKQIINWPDGKGLIAFFKILMALNKLHAYSYEGCDITFNTVEELDAAEKGFLKFYTHFK
jgi:NDP-sugar pyrophosphorylase family protein